MVKIDWSTDGALSMVGLRKGFIGILNEKATELKMQKKTWVFFVALSTNRTCVVSPFDPGCYECGNKNHQLDSWLYITWFNITTYEHIIVKSGGGATKCWNSFTGLEMK